MVQQGREGGEGKSYGRTVNEPHREKTGLLPMRKQRRRSASH